MKKKKKWILSAIAVVAVLLAYPVFVLGYTWTHVFRSDLEGGRHGPLDAYRHALASAVVSYTLDRRAVDFVTHVFESEGKDTNHMDRQNNMIGAAVGSKCQSFGELESSILREVQAGAELSSDPSRITWLPKERWGDLRLW